MDYFYKNKDLNFYDKLITVENGDKILHDFLQGNYKNYYLASYILLCKYIKDVHNESDYKEFRIFFDKFKIIEKDILYDRLEKSKRPQFTIYITENSHFKKKDVLITELYDEDGQKHKWNEYIYDNEHKLIDVKCSTCKINRKDITKLDIKKTWRSVNALSDIDSFYTFYKIRCPKNDLHDWINDVCAKCKLTTVMIDIVNTSKLNSDIIQYYDKYLSEFIREKKTIKHIDQESNLDITNNIIDNIHIDYTYDYTTIVKVSEFTKVVPSIIESIGLTEKRLYSDIEEAINIPIVTEYNVYSAYSELLYLLSNFYQRINSFIDKELYDTLDISKYISLIPNMLKQYPVDIVHKYIIQSICEIIFQIYKINEVLAKELFSEIIQNEKLLSEPTQFNWNVFDPTDDTGIYLGDDIGDSGEDLIQERLLATKGISDVYYSAENIDYDFTEDNPNNELNIENPNEYIYST